MNRPDTRTRIGRRDALRLGALAVGGTVVGGPVLFGRAAAHPKPENHEVVWGDDIDYLADTVRTYATRNPGGALSSLGVYIDDDALAVFDEDQLDVHLALPEAVDAGEFTFVGFDYNAEGHPPPGIYSVPHFDVHFYLTPEETVDAITGGPATYDLPPAQVPTDYIRLPAIDTDEDGEPDTPGVEPGMGEHLGDPTAPEFQPDGEFTHTMIYGVHDDDGDGTGQLTFVEPMVTLDFLRNLDEDVVVDIKTPEEYPVAGQYPTQYAIKPAVTGGVYVAIDSFEEFPGADGSEE